jgi:KaiC/GvpD/RAD55 family RecA-like ATPase
VKDPVITFWANLLETKGGSEWVPAGWDPVFARLSQAQEFQGDTEHPGWSAARFEPCNRAKDNVVAVFALCLDFDKGETIRGMRQKLAGFYGLIHTTRKHTAEAHRFRVVLPLSRPVERDEYEALWSRFAPWAGSADSAARDPSRFWFIPGTRDGGEFEAHRLNGEPLDVDEWLSRPEPQPKYSPPLRQDAPRTRDDSDREGRAVKYIAKMPEAVSGQGGHNVTWDVACVLARGFDLSAAATFDILRREYNPRCEPPWTERELEHKAWHAREKSSRPLGYLLTNDYVDRDWSRSDPVPIDDFPEPPIAIVSSTREPGDDTDEIKAEAEKPKTAGERYGVSTERDMLLEVWEDANKPPGLGGFTTGIRELDALIGKLRRGNVALLAAQTSWGKSSAGVMVLDENRKQGAKVLLISNEDGRLLYGRRLACRRGNFNALLMRDRELGQTDKIALGVMAQTASSDFVFLNAVGKSVELIGKAIRELVAEHGFGLVICDYIQRFKSSKAHQDRRNEVTTVAGELSNAIKESGAAGLLLSQLSRTKDKEPTMDDVKESGDVENMAEHVFLGWRKFERSGFEEKVSRMCNLPKNKDGPVTTQWIELPFNEQTANFKSDIGGTAEADFSEFDA